MAKLSVHADAEGAASARKYFRTRLHDYQRASFRARYQMTGSLNVAADYRVLNNRTPAPGSDYDFRSRQTSLTLLWTPAGGKRVNVQADYTRSTLRFDITYFVPQILQRDRSLYRDNGRSVGALIDSDFPLTGALLQRWLWADLSSALPEAGQLPTINPSQGCRFL